MHEPPKRVDALKTSLEIVRELNRRTEGGVTELATALDIPKSTVYVHLSTLVDEGFVCKEGDRYRLSLRFLELGARVRSETVFTRARDEVDAVAADLGHLTNLMVEENGLGVYVYSVKGEESADLQTVAGRHFPLNTTALGKAILAYMDDERVTQIVNEHGLPAETERTIADRDELFDRLKAIRDRGYAIDQEENLRGVSCIAYPIRVGGTPLGAISVSAPVSQLNDEDFFQTANTRLEDAANVIEVNAEYN